MQEGPAADVKNARPRLLDAGKATDRGQHVGDASQIL